MARATYIWVVAIRGVPVAAFTVKHEMLTWLGRQNPDLDHTIWYLPDGHTSDVHPPRDRSAEFWQ